MSADASHTYPHAWIVRVDDLTCVTFAFTAKAARYNAVKAAWEAGYNENQWPDVRASRSEFFDRSPLRRKGTREVYTEEFVTKSIP